MHKILIEFLGVQITGWKIIGYSGVLLFSARWLVQMWASRAARKPTVPVAFWIMSVAAYNLSLEVAHRRSPASNQQGGANEGQPFNLETNPTSAAAASRRSP